MNELIHYVKVVSRHLDIYIQYITLKKTHASFHINWLIFAHVFIYVKL